MMTSATPHPPHVLGIDLGTSSVKVALVTAEGRVLTQADSSYPIDRPHPGWAETDPEAWWSAIRSAVAAVLSGTDRLPLAIGLSGQMHGVVLVEEDGRAVRPAVLWADARSTAEVERYRLFEPALRMQLGNPFTVGMAGPSLVWLHRHEPAAVARARWAVQPKDWVRARLTGEVSGDHSDASATLLYDVINSRWHLEAAARLGIETRLLPILARSSGDRAGSLLGSSAQDLGLPAGIPVAVGAADTAAALVGSGLFTPGVVQLTIGTGVQIVTPVTPPTAATIPGSPVTHLYRGATADGWYAMAAGLSGGHTLDWVRRILGADWAELYSTAALPARGDDPLFLPHLIGERTPYLDPGLRGAWTGLEPRHTRVDLLRSALEGVAFAVAGGLDVLPGVPRSGRDVRLAGGGTTSTAWRRLLATVLDAHLHGVDVPAVSARGAGLLAAQAAGLFSGPDLPRISAMATQPAVAPGSDGADLRERRARWERQIDALRRSSLPPNAAAGGVNLTGGFEYAR
ncbi:MAG: xylulokinase [Janthinobacterium lividum]